MFNKNRDELKELAELCKPIIRFIANKNQITDDCHGVIITENNIEMVKTELYGLVNVNDKTDYQTLYEGICEHCGRFNEFKMPVGTQLPEGVIPRYCTGCGKEMEYSKVEE